MKKLISFGLAVMLLISVFTVVANAENGPVDYNTETKRFESRITFAEINEDGEYVDEEGYTVGDFDYAGVNVYFEGVATDIDGASYDKKTNTLTLDNFDDCRQVLYVNAMGDDFKIKVVGDCEVARIFGTAGYWGNSIAFVGSGEIAINTDKLFDYAIEIDSDFMPISVTFGKDVKASLYGEKKIAKIKAVSDDVKNKCYAFENGETPATSDEVYCDTYNNYITGFFRGEDDGIPVSLGQIAVSKEDPDGYYTAQKTYAYDDEDDEGYEAYRIKKFLYSKSKDYYYPDYSFGEHGISYIPYEDIEEYFELKTKAVETEYPESMINTKNYGYRQCKSYNDTFGTKFAGFYDWSMNKTRIFRYKLMEEFGDLYMLYDEQKDIDPDTLQSENNYFLGYFIDETYEGYCGIKLKSKSDPEGVYAAYEITVEENDIQTFKGYEVHRYIYSDEYEAYFVDRSLNNDSYDGGLKIAEEDFADSDYSIVYQTEDEPEELFNSCELNINGIHVVYKDKEDNRYVIVFDYDSDYECSIQNPYTFKEIDDISSEDYTYYSLSRASGVDVDKLEQDLDYDYKFGFSNVYLDGTELLYNVKQPVEEPTEEPTEEPSEEPTFEPTEEPTEFPTSAPSEQPSSAPVTQPATDGEELPTVAPVTQAPEEKKEISKLDVRLSKTSYTFNGKAQKPAAEVKDGEKALVSGKDFTVSYKNNKNAGTAKAVVTGIGSYAGTVTKNFKINKAKQKATVNTKKCNVNYNKLKKNNVIVKKAITVKKGKGKVKFKKIKSKISSYFTIDKNGNLIVKKKSAKKNYKLKVKVTASGGSNYKKFSKTVTLTIRVK